MHCTPGAFVFSLLTSDQRLFSPRQRREGLFDGGGVGVEHAGPRGGAGRGRADHEVVDRAVEHAGDRRHEQDRLQLSPRRRRRVRRAQRCGHRGAGAMRLHALLYRLGGDGRASGAHAGAARARPGDEHCTNLLRHKLGKLPW